MDVCRFEGVLKGLFGELLYLVANGSLVGMAVASFFIWNARYMGKTFEGYTESGYIVGEDQDETEDEHTQLGVGQNDENEDTSCAIYKITTRLDW